MSFSFDDLLGEITQEKDEILPHQQEMLDVIQSFEERAWSEQARGIPTGFPSFDKALDGGWQTGWIIVAGQSNIGKTSLISQLAWQASQVNKDVYVLDFSLDDPMHDKIPRVVASANKVIINSVKNPNAYKEFPEMIKRRKQGIDKLKEWVDCYRCYDATHSTDIDVIEETIRKTKTYLELEAQKKQCKAKRLIVFIDNFHDLTTTAKEASFSDKNKYDYLAQRCADMATIHDISIVTSAEFKKINGFRRPQVEDIRESIKIVYEAKVIMLCYNEVSLKGEAANIYFEMEGKADKFPIFEVKFGKNKMGSFKGRVFFEFYQDIAYFEESDNETVKRFNNLIYSNN